LDIKQ
jgi:chromosome segregation ATPase